MTEDLKKFDVPTPSSSGERRSDRAFQPTPSRLQAKLVKVATLKVHKGAPPCLCTDAQDSQQELLTFCFKAGGSARCLAAPALYNPPTVLPSFWPVRTFVFGWALADRL